MNRVFLVLSLMLILVTANLVKAENTLIFRDLIASSLFSNSDIDYVLKQFIANKSSSLKSDDLIYSIDGNRILFLRKDELDCGTSGCLPLVFTRDRNNLEYVGYSRSVQCEEYSKEFKCFPVYERFEYKKLTDLLSPEGFENVYINKQDDKFMILDLKKECFSEEGCSSYYAIIENEQVIPQYLSYPLICYPPITTKIMICESKVLYLEKLTPEFRY